MAFPERNSLRKRKKFAHDYMQVSLHLTKLFLLFATSKSHSILPWHFPRVVLVAYDKAPKIARLQHCSENIVNDKISEISDRLKCFKTLKVAGYI